MNSPAPALSRGLEILRLLSDGSPRSLEDISRVVNTPKSSVVRLLDTLCGCDLVVRDAAKYYTALARIEPLTGESERFNALLDAVMHELSAETGQTAEWYLPDEPGMRLSRRVGPEGDEVQVRARIGFVRGWGAELDAVARVSLAFWGDNFKSGSYSGYVADGVIENTDDLKARSDVNLAACGWAVDPFLNSNGVRRLACIVMNGDVPAGVLALAGFVPPHVDRDASALLSGLLRAGGRLMRNTDFGFKSF